MFKNYSFLALWSLLLLSTVSTAQIDQFEWGMQIDDDALWTRGVKKMTADADGNTFITNQFYGASTLTIGNTTIPMPSGGVMYTAKLDTTGNVVWVKTTTNSNSVAPEPYSIITDSKGDCYIVGQLHSPSNFHGVTIGSQGHDAFVVKINKDGNIDWGQSWAGSSVDWYENSLLSVDLHGSSIRIGGRRGNFYTDLDTATGSIQHQTTGVQALDGTRISVDPQGNNLILDDDAPIMPFTLGGLSYTPTGPVSSILVKQDSAGNSIWIKEFSSTSHTIGDIEIDNFGSIYILGTVTNSLQLDGNTLVTNPNIDPATSNYANFIAKFDPGMNVLWTQYIGGSDWMSLLTDTAVLDLELDPLGNVYVATVSKNGTWIGNRRIVIPNDGATSVVTKLGIRGNIIWVKTIEGYGNGTKALAVSPQGTYLYGGIGSGQAEFGNLTSPITSYKHYITKLNDVQGTNEISGLVFLDDNGNGFRDNNEVTTDAFLVHFNNNYYKSTDTSGTFYNFVANGTYTVGTVLNQYWTQTKPDTTITFTSFWETASGLEFGIEPSGIAIQDLEVYVSSTAIRPGFEVQYFVTFKNVGHTIESGTVELTLNDTLNYISSTNNGSHANSRVTWTYSNLAPNESRTVKVKCQMPVALGLLGTNMSATAIIEPVANDFTPANNIFIHSQQVTGSYDPNDKQVSPSGAVDTNFVNDGTFVYTIRFQNTGNDTAFTVRVADTLDNQLDISTFQMIGASHDYILDLDNRAIMWTFNDILLPDSTTNEPESHGFILYSIRPKASTMLGDTIANTAHIYFDYNPAIITNTTISDVQIVTQTHQVTTQQLERINIFPNPTSGWLTCEVENFQAHETYFFRLFDMQGRLVTQQQVTSDRQTIDLPPLPSGMYVFQLMSAESGLKGTGKLLTR